MTGSGTGACPGTPTTGTTARAWLRDAFNDHRLLTEQAAALSTTDDRLAEFADMDLRDYQADRYRQFPYLEKTDPTVVNIINGGMS